jgi:hypothetical protein
MVASMAALIGCASDPPANTRNSAQGGAGMTGGPAGPGAPPTGSIGTNAGTSGSITPGGSSGSSSPSTAGSSSTPMGAGSGANPGPGAMVDCSALPLPSNSDDIVSTFEDGTGNVMQVGGRGGGFYMFNDGSTTGMQMPPPGSLPNARMDSRCGGMFAMCMQGSGFTVWGAGMGTDLGMTTTDSGGMMVKGTYDASMYSGISFWAKANMGSSLAVRVGVKDKNTAPEGGVCDPMMSSGAEACNDDWSKNLNLTTTWAPYTIMFSELRQANWGKAFPAFDAANTYSIQFQVNQNLTFDLCIDDLAFVR